MARGETRVLSSIAAAIESGSTSLDQVLRLLNQIEFEHARDEPLVVTFSLFVPDVLEMDVIPAYLIGLGYPALCDRLEHDLVEFAMVAIDESFHYSEASSLDGEVLGVRLVFPMLSIDDEIDLTGLEQYIPWWEIVEVSNFFKIYGIT